MCKVKKFFKVLIMGILMVISSLCVVVSLGCFGYGIYYIKDCSGWVSILVLCLCVIYLILGVSHLHCLGRVYLKYKETLKNKNIEDSESVCVVDEKVKYQVTYLYKVINNSSEPEFFKSLNIEEGGYCSVEDVEKDTERVFKHLSDEKHFNGARLLVYQLVRNEKGFSCYKKYYVLCYPDQISIVLREGDK